jgi:hypothetical protein
VFEQKIGHRHNSKLSGTVRHLLDMCTEAALGIQAIMHGLNLHKLNGKFAAPYTPADILVG